MQLLVRNAQQNYASFNKCLCGISAFTLLFEETTKRNYVCHNMHEITNSQILNTKISMRKCKDKYFPATHIHTCDCGKNFLADHNQNQNLEMKKIKKKQQQFPIKWIRSEKSVNIFYLRIKL